MAVGGVNTFRLGAPGERPGSGVGVKAKAWPAKKVVQSEQGSGSVSDVKQVLPDKFIETFAGGRYTSRILEKDTIFYRAGNSKKIEGSYFSKDKPISELQVRIDKAIPPVWQDGQKNVIDTVYTFKARAGTVVHTGKISSQNKHFIGGTQQVVIDQKFWDALELLKKEPLK